MPQTSTHLPPTLLGRLERLTADQRAAATAPPGPTLCIAPAGSGKTTTLIARICWLLGTGAAAAGEVTAVTFNKRAAVELEERLATALAELTNGDPRRAEPSVEPGAERRAEPGVEPPTKVRVRTFHALAREILIDAGARVEPLADRMATLRAVRPTADGAELGRLDTAISRLKLDLGVTAVDVDADPEPGPTATAFVAYERAIAATGGLDFDDLLVRALARLDADAALLERWRARCAHLLVDEAQDLDRSQLRLALLLAAPANRIFLVGDDDQSIYGWRLADVRRLLGLAETSLPDLRRVDLVTNFRCPAPVIDRAVRLIEHNRERFAKTVLARDDARGSLVLARSNADDVDRIESVIRSWPDDGGTRAILARTNRELVPAAVAAIRLDLPFVAPDLTLPVESTAVDEALGELGGGSQRALVAVARWQPPGAEARSIRVLLLAWAAGFERLDDLRAAINATRAAVARLRGDDAPLSLATAHGTKGLEFDHVAVIGLDEGRFPSARSVSDSAEPERALEEERRLAYVAWTRARRSLTLLYDPGAPSEFLLEAFSAAELGLVPGLT